MQSELQNARLVFKESGESLTETRFNATTRVQPDRLSPVIVEGSGRCPTPDSSECSCPQPMEMSEVVVDLPAEAMDQIIERYEERCRALEMEINRHSRAHMTAIHELREGVKARDELLLKLADILSDINTTMNDDKVPARELRLLFSSHAQLPEQVKSQLRTLRTNEEHALVVLSRSQEELSARHHEVHGLIRVQRCSDRNL